MESTENDSETSSSVIACLQEQNALVRSGRYWDCLAAARKLSTLLLAEGRSPWLARLRKTEVLGDEVFHAPLMPRGVSIKATWTTHYVCCCDAKAFDPLAGKPLQLEAYSLKVFGEEIPMEVFVPTVKLPAYLAGKPLQPSTLEGVER